MDLRIVKTRAAILEAWEKLRSKKPTEAITVKELAAMAQINKATFYLHFHDVYDLADYWERQMVSQVLDSLPPAEEFLADPVAAVQTLAQAFIQKSALLDAMYAYGNHDRIAEKLEQGMLHYVFGCRPDWTDNEQARIILQFTIYGGFHAFIRNKERNLPEVLSALSTVATRLVPLMQ